MRDVCILVPVTLLLELAEDGIGKVSQSAVRW